MTRALHYILDEHHKPVATDLMTWAKWFENIENRSAGYTIIDVDCYVSTVFLGLDHSFLDDSEPILFETMIFGGPLDQQQWRYRTWDEALRGHEDAVELAKLAKAAEDNDL